MSRGNIEILAPAKINLYLSIKKRREDGYHELETVMQKIDLADRIKIAKVDSGISLRCIQRHNGSSATEKNIPEDETNLACRAAVAFFEASGCEPGVAITLEKNIPVAAGLGGGSSDAGAVLSGLYDLFPKSVSMETLYKIAGRLGADVPLFVNKSAAVFASGIGDVLHPIEPLSECYIVLVNPGFPVSTKWVYDNFALTSDKNPYTLGPDLKLSEVLWGSRMAADLQRYSVDTFYNDLELITSKKHSEIDQCKEQLSRDGADCTLMSGSGPTVYGIFRDIDKAQKSRDSFKNKYNEVFLCQPLLS